MVERTAEHNQKIGNAIRGRFVGKSFGEARKDGGYINCLYCKSKRYVNKKRLNLVKYCNQDCYIHYKNEVMNPLKGFKHSEKSKERYKNKVFTEKHRKNLSKSATGRVVSNTTREKIRQNTIRQHLEGKFPQVNTLIERIIEKKLTEEGIDFEHPFAFGRFVCDFAIVDKNVIVECDGDYWHNREDVKKKDKAKNAYLQKSGWKVLRFWEHQIKESPDDCIKIIKENLEC